MGKGDKEGMYMIKVLFQMSHDLKGVDKDELRAASTLFASLSIKRCFYH
jgi:hypothetical protein